MLTFAWSNNWAVSNTLQLVKVYVSGLIHRSLQLIIFWKRFRSISYRSLMGEITWESSPFCWKAICLCTPFLKFQNEHIQNVIFRNTHNALLSEIIPDTLFWAFHPPGLILLHCRLQFLAQLPSSSEVLITEHLK